ncbi:trans-sulfuration enzyme family protein [Pyrinomonas methylaliphatogenes]|mgnify:CR=1 FL=1|jgi:cystathionine beta-lyase/cystathionine gamma-synthase|uniref:Cystathionine beta-lyase/cystathionine gamma-synthase n=1 Tax=Pyrinomonas methylaliphatogenes TaxID=454194 RepID=A0A0B6WVG3_9BACT|nr:PLP-dependent aspartate aminotransferase family protein [Pyrinomonas methylaliphatogenes]MBX5479728.1 PLP-dependent transferase [Pyrinomonas methylaliphatogenes]CDM64085.1 cystathionine beta-lyase/cystathionine gamma-synthase [Pyrinomonas methylaliphatogenes]
MANTTEQTEQPICCSESTLGTEEFVHFETLALHAGASPDPVTGALLPPIYQTTTYRQEAVGVHKGFTYSRAGNPTVAALERRLAALEGAPYATCYATGLAATTALCLALLEAGDRVIVSQVVYGGTVRLLQQFFARFGVRADFVDTSDLGALKAALREPARLVFIETPANPTLKLTDIEAAANLAHAAGALLVVDNTLLTPALQRPFEFGADIVLHSTTKFIEGHNATVGGALIVRDKELHERFEYTRTATGTIQAPFTAWLTLQGVKTLPLRMERHSENALRVARFLEKHPRIKRLIYPGLESFPQYELARRQQKSGGALIAFEVEGGTEAGIRLMNSVRLCALAENLGAAETLVTHPASMTHWSVPSDQREAAGITDGLVRLSVGLENPEDIIADLDRALRQ